MTERIEVVTFAASWDGIGVNPKDPEARRLYLDFLAPGETPARAIEIGNMSGCALTQRAILRAFIDHPLLANPYRDRMAMADLGQIAKEADALHGPSHDPEPGDILIVGGEDPRLGGPEHTWMLFPDGTGIDGGQRDDQGFEMIRIKPHQLSGGWDLSTMHRKIQAVLDLRAILNRFGK